MKENDGVRWDQVDHEVRRERQCVKTVCAFEVVFFSAFFGGYGSVGGEECDSEATWGSAIFTAALLTNA